VSGKGRYINDSGRRRKFKAIDTYVERWTERAE
jgi:hypothetical protein